MRFVFLFFLFFTSVASASTYTWENSSGTFASPQAACESVINASYGYEGSQYTVSSVTYVLTSPDHAQCSGTVLRPKDSGGGSFQASGGAARSGNACQVDAVYDATTGICSGALAPFVVGALCDSQEGATPGNPIIHSISGLCQSFRVADDTASCMYLAATHPTGSMKVPGTLDSSGAGVPPKMASVFGGMCEGSVTSGDCVVGPTKCTKGLCTSPSTSSCVIQFSFTGRPAANVPPDLGLAGKDSICDMGADCNLPPPETTDENKPCSKVTDAEGRQSCTTSNFTGTDGAVNCGSVNGEFGCRGSYPASKGIEIASTTAVQALIDGSTKEVTTNKATQSVCSGGMGPGVCVISTSTSISTTSHSSTGVVSGTATTCSGSLCGNASTTTGTGSGTGTGTASGGVGDCVKDCGTPAGSSPKASSLSAPTQGNFDGEADKWQKKIDDSKTEVIAALDKMKALFKPISNISLGGGGQLYCPPPVQVLGHTISFCLDDYASSLGWISQVVLLVCTVSAMFIIFL